MALFLLLPVSQKPLPNSVREELANRIASLAAGGTYLQLGCTWMCESEEIADEFRNRLSIGLSSEEALVVLEIGDQAAWGGLTEDQAEWLIEHVGATAQSYRSDPAALPNRNGRFWN
jgi:hypothetical protein